MVVGKHIQNPNAAVKIGGLNRHGIYIGGLQRLLFADIFLQYI